VERGLVVIGSVKKKLSRFKDFRLHERGSHHKPKKLCVRLRSLGGFSAMYIEQGTPQKNKEHLRTQKEKIVKIRFATGLCALALTLAAGNMRAQELSSAHFGGLI
jgi:hypothetical protein